jgi:hypothetical protein
MTANEQGKQLFGVRIYPESAPHVMMAILATSASEAEDMARERTGHRDAPATVRQCAEDEPILITFR